MVVFHGSDVAVACPVILTPKRPLDFGAGFYVTESREQSESWAKKVAIRNFTTKRIVSIYDFDVEAAEKSVHIIRFDNVDSTWLNFICNNRKGLTDFEYDIAIGPVADDKVYKVVIEYEIGIIDEARAIKRLKAEKLYNQIVFHTEDALKYVEYITSEVL
ncbi:MAG: DUF3990 domain-containing protein [Clostridia bacterium]|nr:DUF3990 domain-containing protein [Clostridia bacterium]